MILYSAVPFRLTQPFKSVPLKRDFHWVWEKQSVTQQKKAAKSKHCFMKSWFEGRYTENLKKGIFFTIPPKRHFLHKEHQGSTKNTKLDVDGALCPLHYLVFFVLPQIYFVTNSENNLNTPDSGSWLGRTSRSLPVEWGANSAHHLWCHFWPPRDCIFSPVQPICRFFSGQTSGNIHP